MTSCCAGDPAGCDQLPPHTQTEALPGCGHVPIADDPAAVAALIIRTAAQADPRAAAPNTARASRNTAPA